jgi:hypothetical protein
MFSVSYTISLVDGTWHIIDTSSIYDMVRLLLRSQIEDSMTSRIVLASIRNKRSDTGESCRKPKLNALRFSI